MNFSPNDIILSKNTENKPKSTLPVTLRAKDYITGKFFNKRSFHFLPLYAPPDSCDAVLLSCHGVPDKIFVNGQGVSFSKYKTDLWALPVEPFNHWENVLSLETHIKEASLLPVIKKSAQKGSFELNPAVPWTLRSMDGRKTSHPVIQESANIDSTTISSLAETLLNFIISTGNNKGDVWSFYDVKDQTYRLHSWRWDTAIVLEALATAGTHTGSTILIDAAKIIGDRFLQIQQHNKECEGGIPEWVDFRYSESKETVTEWVAPFNAGFFGSALTSLYHATGKKKYIEASKRSIFNAITKGLTKNGGVAGYYFAKSHTWQYLGQINDSGIFARALATLAVAADDDIQDLADRAITVSNYIIEKANYEDGSFGRAWYDPAGAFPAGPPLFPEWKKNPNRLVPKIFLRGQAWVLFGLNATHQLTLDKMIGQKADELVDFLVSVQQDDGSWLYSQLQPQLGPCVKGTATLAFALMEYIQSTGHTKILSTVKKALGFLDTVRSGDTGLANLSLAPVDSSEEGCIIYFRNRRVICAYALAMEVLARIQLDNFLR